MIRAESVTIVKFRRFPWQPYPLGRKSKNNDVDLYGKPLEMSSFAGKTVHREMRVHRGVRDSRSRSAKPILARRIPVSCATRLGRGGEKTLFIEPGSQWENGFIESFSGKLRYELLDRAIFEHSAPQIIGLTSDRIVTTPERIDWPDIP